jgi:flagellar motor switch protein FliN
MNLESQQCKSYIAGWNTSLSQLLSQLGGASWECEAGVGALDEAPVAAASIRCPKLSGLQTVVLSPSALAELLSLFLGEPTTVTQAPDATQREALEELMRQWCGLAATALKPEFGEVSFEVTCEKPAPSRAGEFIVLRARSGSQSIACALQFDAALQAFLSAPEPSKPVVACASQPESNSRIDELLHQGNLELLMDVELPVMLRFGCREATLREVLEMATGAVLELDREIQEPVDLVLNGKIIARGEVVVIDGDFGLRVTEVASPQQRVNSFTAA